MRLYFNGQSRKGRTVRYLNCCFGFSIFELMIAMAILATVLSIATWSMGYWMPDIRLRAAVRSITSDLHAARMTAIQQNAFVVSDFDTGRNRYVIYIDDGADDALKAHNYQLDLGEAIIKSVDLPPHLNIIRAQFGAVSGKFAFNSRGATNGFAGGIYLNNKKKSYRGVAVSRIGKITVKVSEDGSVWQPAH
jgi:prepilin-type N-terminal cleavage/methylation domain-containing protein